MRNLFLVFFASLWHPLSALSDDALDWGGYYGGIAVNFSQADSLIVGNRYTYNQNQAVNLVDHDYDGLGLSGYFGWNAVKRNLVYGAEISLGGDDLESNLVFNADNDIDQVQVKWSGALSARLGYSLNRTLLYTKGGVAFARIKNVGGDVNGGILDLSDAHIRDKIYFGPTASVGAERFFSKKIAGRFEYSYADYGGYSQANQNGAPGSQVYQVNNGPIQKISLGITYKF